MDALLREQPAHPLQKVVAFVDAFLDEDAQPLADEWNAVLPVLVLELAEVQVEDDVLELRGGVTGGNQSRGDRTGGGPGDVLRFVSAFVEHRERARKSDPLDAAAFA